MEEESRRGGSVSLRDAGGAACPWQREQRVIRVCALERDASVCYGARRDGKKGKARGVLIFFSEGERPHEEGGRER